MVLLGIIIAFGYDIAFNLGWTSNMILEKTPGSTVTQHNGRYLFFPDSKFGPTFGVTLEFTKVVPNICPDDQYLNATVLRNDFEYESWNNSDCVVDNNTNTIKITYNLNDLMQGITLNYIKSWQIKFDIDTLNL